MWCNLIWGILFYPFSYKIMHFLSNFRSCCFSSSDCPNWFISYNNLAPIFNSRFNDVKLFLNHFVCSSFWSFVSMFSNTNNTVKSTFLSFFYFLFNNFISLIKKKSSFWMSDYCPVNTKVFKLFSTNFTCVSSIGELTNVLCTYLNVIC